MRFRRSSTWKLSTKCRLFGGAGAENTRIPAALLSSRIFYFKDFWAKAPVSGLGCLCFIPALQDLADDLRSAWKIGGLPPGIVDRVEDMLIKSKRDRFTIFSGGCHTSKSTMLTLRWYHHMIPDVVARG